MVSVGLIDAVAGCVQRQQSRAWDLCGRGLIGFSRGKRDCPGRCFKPCLYPPKVLTAGREK